MIVKREAKEKQSTYENSGKMLDKQKIARLNKTKNAKQNTT